MAGVAPGPVLYSRAERLQLSPAARPRYEQSPRVRRGRHSTVRLRRCTGALQRGHGVILC